jgi:small GTP-binding protein
VRSENARAALRQVLSSLDEYASDGLRTRVSELARRLREDRFRVLVVGEAKRGKSTFVNALLRRDILPVGVTPLTAIATTVGYGVPEEVRVRFLSGRTETRSLGELPDLVTERANPGNRLGLAAVEVRLDVPMLAEGVEIVDTPGTGSVYEQNTAEATAALEAMDAAVFVLTVDPPISASERTLLHTVSLTSVATFVVLNKADRLDADEQREAREFTEQVVREATGESVPVHACSARAAAAPGRPHDAGFVAFEQDFRGFLTGERATALLSSIRRQGKGLAETLLDETRATRRADALRSGHATDRVDGFRRKLDDLAELRREGSDRLHAEAKRLLAELNESAERAASAVRTSVLRAVAEYLDTELDGAGVSEIEERGLRHAAELITAQVEPWRAERAERIQRGITDMDTGLSAKLDEALDALRPAARELLDLKLSVPRSEVCLVENPRFFYQFQTGIDASAVVNNALRRTLPGALGRRRAAKHVLDLVGSLAPQQVGRVRGDLQERLAETVRQFDRALAVRYGDYAERLAEALRTAERLSEMGEIEGSALRARLAERETALLRLRDELAEPPVPGAATRQTGSTPPGLRHGVE